MIRVIKPILNTYPEFQELNNALKVTGLKLFPQPYRGSSPCSPYYLIMLCLTGVTVIRQCRMGAYSSSANHISVKMINLLEQCINKLRKEPVVRAALLRHLLGVQVSDT